MSLIKNTFLIIQWFLLFFWGYWFIISLFGFGKPKRIGYFAPQKRFLILIPAHNEEKVIGSLIDNLKMMDYPKELYDIYVIADECSDQTAKIVIEKGGNVIEHKYKPDEPKGKPHAIRYALETLDIDKYDAICVFDADNLVSINYLQEMNNHLMKGDKLIQCYLDSKNPRDNWITLGYATSYYYMNRSWQLAKSRLGLPNAIGGTGFCVDVSLIKEIGWTARSLTEDLEFTVQCVLKGISPKWSHFSRVFDEKPTNFKASCIQRLRWARGHWDVCFRYSLPLLWRFIRYFDIKAFDTFLYLVNPGKAVLGAVTGLTFYLSYFSGNPLFQPLIPMAIWIVLITFQFIYVAGCIIFDSNYRLNEFKSFLSLLIFNYTYIPLFIWGFITSHNRSWKRTEHTRNLSSEEMKMTI